MEIIGDSRLYENENVAKTEHFQEEIIKIDNLFSDEEEEDSFELITNLNKISMENSKGLEECVAEKTTNSPAKFESVRTSQNLMNNNSKPPRRGMS